MKPLDIALAEGILTVCTVILFSVIFSAFSGRPLTEENAKLVAELADELLVFMVGKAYGEAKGR